MRLPARSAPNDVHRKGGEVLRDASRRVEPDWPSYDRILKLERLLSAIRLCELYEVLVGGIATRSSRPETTLRNFGCSIWCEYTKCSSTRFCRHPSRAKRYAIYLPRGTLSITMLSGLSQRFRKTDRTRQSRWPQDAKTISTKVFVARTWKCTPISERRCIASPRMQRTPFLIRLSTPVSGLAQPPHLLHDTTRATSLKGVHTSIPMVLKIDSHLRALVSETCRSTVA